MKTYWDNLSHDYQFCPTNDLDFVCDFLKDNAESVMEFSSGSGYLIKMLRDKGWKGFYIGSDYNDNFIKASQENNPNEFFCKIDLSQPIDRPSQSSDICVIRHGLEYVYPYRLALSEMKRIAKKFIVLDFWVNFTEENRIVFNEEGKWNVNYYSKKEFDETLKELNLDVFLFQNVRNSNSKVNYIYILKPVY